MGSLVPHARQRAQERYGIDLTQDVQRRIVQAIKGGHTKARRLTTGRSRHEVEIDGTRLVVIYSNEHKRIITVLPAKKRRR